MAAFAVPVIAEAAIATSLAPILPAVAAGAALGAVSIQLVRWWRASVAAAAVAKAAAAQAATAAAAAAKAAAEVAAAEAVQAATAAAPVAAEAAAAGAVDAAATMSLPVLLGYGCILVAVAGGGYILYRKFYPKNTSKASTDTENPNSQTESQTTQSPPTGNSDDENDDKKNKGKPRPPNPKKKMKKLQNEGPPRPTIPKKKMEELLKNHGKKIWQNLRNAGPDEGANKRREIWRNKDYRVESTGAWRDGEKKAPPNMRGWELQKNQGATKKVRQSVKGSTHKQHFVDNFDTVNKPDYESFKQSILDKY